MSNIIKVIRAKVEGWDGVREYGVLFLIQIVVLALLYKAYNYITAGGDGLVLNAKDFALSMVVAVLITSYQTYQNKVRFMNNEKN